MVSGRLWCGRAVTVYLELKRTRSESVLYFLIRTTVQNAFGKITNAFARTLLSNVSDAQINRGLGHFGPKFGVLQFPLE